MVRAILALVRHNDHRAGYRPGCSGLARPGRPGRRTGPRLPAVPARAQRFGFTDCGFPAERARILPFRACGGEALLRSRSSLPKESSIPATGLLRGRSADPRRRTIRPAQYPECAGSPLRIRGRARKRRHLSRVLERRQIPGDAPLQVLDHRCLAVVAGAPGPGRSSRGQPILTGTAAGPLSGGRVFPARHVMVDLEPGRIYRDQPPAEPVVARARSRDLACP